MRFAPVAVACLLAAHAAGAQQPAGIPHLRDLARLRPAWAGLRAMSLNTILGADEGEYVDGRRVRGLRMNGDQTHQGRHVSLGGGFSMQRVKRYRYR